MSLACIVCCAACGGRTSPDLTDAIGAEGGGGSSATTGVNSGGNSPTTSATGGTAGSGATTGVNSGGSGAAIGATGGKSGVATSPTGGKSGVATSPTGGKSSVTTSATGGKGGSGATTSSTGGKGGSGGTTSSTGGKGSGGATTSATGGAGGSGAKSSTGGTTSATTGGSSASGGTAGSGGTSSTVITTCNDSFPFLGTWEGNILDFYFEPQEALKLVLSADASGVITGKLTWGDGAPPPAPQGADIPYPPGYWEQHSGTHYLGSPDPWPGFAYTIVRGAGCDTTFRFGVSTSELWQDWCALQTPIDSGSFGWGCTLLGGSGSSNGTTCTIYGQNGQTQTYPIWKCNACGSFGMNGVCACDQSGCFANTTATETFNLTYSVSGSTEILSGPDPSCSDCTVRLERKN